MKQYSTMKLSLFCIAAITICSVCDGKVVMEYIGNSGAPMSLGSVPIDPSIDFHFILGYANDLNSSGESQYGVFTPSWSTSITPASIRSVKAHHPNVKVLAGILGFETFAWYKPQDSETWVTNAFNSIQSMVIKYHLDGIDVGYELVPNDDTTFIFCIGQLIARLKIYGVISVATISPNHYTATHYIRLYRGYYSVIDYVNHQFSTDRATSPKAYLEFFRLRSTQFNGTKLLPYYNANALGIKGDGFLEALWLLVKNGFQVNGVAIYSADASKSNGYYYEKKAQAFLLGKNSTATMF